MAHDLATQFDKRVMLTEIGYMNSSNAASQPGSFTDKGVRDDHLQATLYKAAIIASQHIRSLDGIIFWQWELEKLDTTKIDYSPQGREAEQVLREFWL